MIPYQCYAQINGWEGYKRDVSPFIPHINVIFFHCTYFYKYLIPYMNQSL